MTKRLNIRNIVIVLVVLALVHFGVGLFFSPKLGGYMVGKINQYSQAKISLDRVNFWPLTLSLSLKDLKIFDPQNTDKKIAEIKKASVYLSPIGLLSKRLILSEIKISGANINLEGESDGTFNIQRLTQPKTSEKPAIPTGILEKAIRRKDWLTKAYDLLKKRFSSDALKKAKARAVEAKKVTKTVAVFPKGRRVHFKSKDSYLLEMKRVFVTGSYLDLKNQDGRSAQVENARIELDRVAFDPELGLRLEKAKVEGQIRNAGVAAGSLKFFYQSIVDKGEPRAQFNFVLREVNLDALRFIYEDSLPVEIVKGMLDFTSETTLDNGNINSGNKLVLSNHELKPKGLTESVDSFMPMPLLCENLNKIDPMRLEFIVSGTVDKPQFEGFMRSLADLVKQNLQNIGQALKSEVIEKSASGLLEAVSGKKASQQRGVPTGGNEEKNNTQNAVSFLQSMFGRNEQDPHK